MSSQASGAAAAPPLPHIAARIFNAPLLIAPGPAAALVSGLAERLGVLPLRAAMPFAAADRRGERGAEALYAVDDGVATITILGELVNRSSWASAASGLTSYGELTRALRQAEADPKITGIVLDIDSPGGEAAGAMETADVVRSVAARKPVVAFVNGLAASAAYAIAAGASEIVTTPSATLGSIGVVYLHLDRSRALEGAGVKPTLIHAGARKVDGNSLRPLDAAAQASIQSQIDDVYALFVGSVGKHRPTLGREGARQTEAAIYVGQKAVEAGLADRIGAMNDALRAARRGAASAGARAASASPPAPAKAAAAPVIEPSGRPAVASQLAGDLRARALAAAREKGVEAEAMERWVAEFVAGALDARGRVAAILDCDAAKGRDKLAQRLALDTDMSVEQASEALSHAAIAPARAPPKPPEPERVYTSLREYNEAVRRGETNVRVVLTVPRNGI